MPDPQRSQRLHVLAVRADRNHVVAGISQRQQLRQKQVALARRNGGEVDDLHREDWSAGFFTGEMVGPSRPRYPSAMPRSCIVA